MSTSCSAATASIVSRRVGDQLDGGVDGAQGDYTCLNLTSLTASMILDLNATGVQTITGGGSLVNIEQLELCRVRPPTASRAGRRRQHPRRRGPRRSPRRGRRRPHLRSGRQRHLARRRRARPSDRRRRHPDRQGGRRHHGGGAGADRFAFSGPGQGEDLIRDFSKAQDRFNLDGKVFTAAASDDNGGTLLTWDGDVVRVEKVAGALVRVGALLLQPDQASPNFWNRFAAVTWSVSTRRSTRARRAGRSGEVRRLIDSGVAVDIHGIGRAGHVDRGAAVAPLVQLVM